MKKEIYGAAAKGNVEFLKEAQAKDVESATAAYSNTDLLGLTSHGNNIIHVAAQHCHLDFIEVALKSFQEADDQRKLICGTNSDGDTPLHFAAKHRTQLIAECLLDFYQKLSFTEEDKIMEASSGAPWRIQNKDGNTPLHVALMNGGRSIRVAQFLLDVDPEVAAIKNNRKEAPLHLAVMYDHQGTQVSDIYMINSLNQGATLSTKNSLFVQENEDTSVSLVSSLLEKNSQVCCLWDEDGLTPLLRAAINSNIQVVDVIINECPESIEVCDPTGKNMLHYIRFPTSWEARKLLENPNIPALLIDQQDHDGNTPAHIAVMNHDFGMVKALVHHHANFAIKNKEGVSAQTLFDQFAINYKLDDVSDNFQMESKSSKFCKLVEYEKEKEVIKEELMSNDLYKAVGTGEWETLRKKLNESSYDKQFLFRLPDGSNIIHLAIQGLIHYKQFADPEEQFAEEAMEKYLDQEQFIEDSSKKYPDLEQFKEEALKQYSDQEQFIEEALEKYPLLLSQTNRLGETPLHLKMFHRMWRPREVSQLYENIKNELMNMKRRGELPLPLPLPPWKVKDVKGNTILHTAIKYENYEFAEYLIEIDASLAGEVNHSKQTPLHLLCYNRSLVQQINVEKLFGQDGSSAVYSRDVEGLTPLLIAAQNGYDNVAHEILKQHPQSIRQIDPHARNFFHLLNNHFSDLLGLSKMVSQREMEILITKKDDQGNTPFDLALEKRHFWKAQTLIEWSSDLKGQLLKVWIRQHKCSTRDMIYEGRINSDFEDFLKSRGVDALLNLPLYRSIYGVRREDIKDFMNPMGVVAALLATVTFTAAFTVPGGYDGDTGIPNLGKEAAFKVFMVADVVGMCSSMMVLFCLLWLLTRQDTIDDFLEEDQKQVFLIDMSIQFLLISFYATLVAFMTGVYVTTISQTRWFAIFTCVFCSFFILLMRITHILYLSLILRALRGLMFRILPYYLKKLLSKTISTCCQLLCQVTDHNEDRQQDESGSPLSS